MSGTVDGHRISQRCTWAFSIRQHRDECEGLTVIPSAALSSSPHNTEVMPSAPDARSTGARFVPFGRYLLLERFAIGGMAEVWLAKRFMEDGSVSELLALKRILPDLSADPQFIKMFIDEASIAGQLNHPGIVPIREVGKKGGAYYMAMDYVWGRDLLGILRRSVDSAQMPPVTVTAFIGARICEALYFAHTRTDRNGQPLGVVHRDVSPQNVLVSFDGAVRLIDFGIAKAQVRQTKTQIGTLKGKVGYMSPEQVRSNVADHRSDQFTLAICLYEMLTGRPLFARANSFEAMNRVRDAVVPPLLEVAPWVPPTLAQVVMRALSLKPEHRFPSAQDMQRALSEFVREQDTNFSHASVARWIRTLFAEQMLAEKHHLDTLDQIGRSQLEPTRARTNSATHLDIPLELAAPANFTPPQENWDSDARRSVEHMKATDPSGVMAEVYFDALGKAATVQFDAVDIAALQHPPKPASIPKPASVAPPAITTTPVLVPNISNSPSTAAPPRATILQGSAAVVIGVPLRIDGAGKAPLAQTNANSPSGFPSAATPPTHASPTLLPPKNHADRSAEVAAKSTMFLGGHEQASAETTRPEPAIDVDAHDTQEMSAVPQVLVELSARPSARAPSATPIGFSDDVSLPHVQVNSPSAQPSAQAPVRHFESAVGPHTVAMSPAALNTQAMEALLPVGAAVVRSQPPIARKAEPSERFATNVTPSTRAPNAPQPVSEQARHKAPENPIIIGPGALTGLLFGALFLGGLLSYAWLEVGATGSIEVRTQPVAAHVWVDGRDRGVAPLRIEHLAPGSHTVKLTAPGYHELTRPISLAAHGGISLDLALHAE